MWAHIATIDAGIKHANSTERGVFRLIKALYGACNVAYMEIGDIKDAKLFFLTSNVHKSDHHYL